MNSETQYRKKSPAIKRARFADSSTLVIIDRKSRQEFKELWYSKQEIKQFRQNTNEFALVARKTPAATAYVLQSMAVDGQNPKHLEFDTDQLCGIEHLLCPQVVRALLTSKYLNQEQVIGEQARQQITGEHDIEKIAEVSRKTSEFSRLWRRRIAVMNSLD